MRGGARSAAWGGFFSRLAEPLQKPTHGRHTHARLVLLGNLCAQRRERAIVALCHEWAHAVLDKLAQGCAFPSCPGESVGRARVTLPADEIPDSTGLTPNSAVTWRWE